MGGGLFTKERKWLGYVLEVLFALALLRAVVILPENVANFLRIRDSDPDVAWGSLLGNLLGIALLMALVIYVQKRLRRIRQRELRAKLEKVNASGGRAA